MATTKRESSDHRAPVRYHHRRDDPDPEPAGVQEILDYGALRWRVAFLRLLGRTQIDARDGGVDRADDGAWSCVNIVIRKIRMPEGG